MDDVHISQSSETPTGHIDTGNATADHTEEDEAVHCVREAIHIGSLDGNHEWAPKGSILVEIGVVGWNAHADEPDVDDEEGEHAPENWSDRLFDC